MYVFRRCFIYVFGDIVRFIFRNFILEDVNKGKKVVNMLYFFGGYLFCIG